MNSPADHKRLRKAVRSLNLSEIVLVSSLILGPLCCESAWAAGPERVTTSFDVKLASAVLGKVTHLFSAGFGQAESSRVAQDINALRPDRPKIWQFKVQYQGKSESLEIRALLDDLGQIDLDFATSPDAAHAVRSAVDGYLNSR